jgi:hypothetical protein
MIHLAQAATPSAPAPPVPPAAPVNIAEDIPPLPTPPGSDAPRAEWDQFKKETKAWSVAVEKKARQKVQIALGENSAFTGATASASRRHSESASDVLPIVAVVFLFLYLIVRAIMAPFCRKNRAQQAHGGSGFSQDEVALMHKMQRTLGQMETRVEALETILIEQQSSQRSRRMTGATVGAASGGGAPSSETLRSNPNI